MQYVALLRGVNVSGKNKIDMKELKAALEEAGCQNVVTCLNSGNVIFELGAAYRSALARELHELILERFGLDIPLYLMNPKELADILDHAPSWWGTGNKEIYDNLIVLLPGTGIDEVYEVLGEPKEGIEQVQDYGNCIFWSFDLSNYRKSTWWSKTASTEIKDKITIRTANTMKKILKLCNS